MDPVIDFQKDSEGFAVRSTRNNKRDSVIAGGLVGTALLIAATLTVYDYLEAQAAKRSVGADFCEKTATPLFRDYQEALRRAMPGTDLIIDAGSIRVGDVTVCIPIPGRQGQLRPW